MNKMLKLSEFLKKLRQTAGVGTQQDAAQRLTDLGRKTSQALIAQYETGRIADPDAEVLRLLAEAYGNTTFDQLMLKWARTKRESVEPPTGTGSAMWDLIESLPEISLPKIGEVPGLDAYRFAALAELAAKEILSLEGVLHWTRNFPDLKQVLVVVPNFLDVSESVVFDNTVSTIKERGAEFIYFVNDGDVADGGDFSILRQQMIRDLGKELFEESVLAVPLPDEELKLHTTDQVIAIPSKVEKAAGFEFLRSEGRPDIAFRMDNVTLRQVTASLLELVKQYAPSRHANVKGVKSNLSGFIQHLDTLA